MTTILKVETCTRAETASAKQPVARWVTKWGIQVAYKHRPIQRSCPVGGTRRPCQTTYLYNTSQELYFHISVEYLLRDILTKWNKVHEQWGYPKGISAIKPEKVCSIASWLMTYQQPLRLVHPSLISQVLCLKFIQTSPTSNIPEMKSLIPCLNGVNGRVTIGHWCLTLVKDTGS